MSGLLKKCRPKRGFPDNPTNNYALVRAGALYYGTHSFKKTMKTTRHIIVEALHEISMYYSDMRFGQMVSNVTYWTTGPKPEAIWEVEDKEFLKTLKTHLGKKRAEKKK